MSRRKIVLIGAGSAMFTQGLVADLIMDDRLGKWEIALVDTDRVALEAITRLVEIMIQSRQADILLRSSTERKEVLSGTDVVVTTIAVGGRRAWEKDVFIPRRYGIYQPVGDTTMPGGISRALRMIPVMLDIAQDVKTLCPDAYFFNYSNPMTPICQAIRQELEVEVVGLCHGVFHVEQHIGRLLGLPDPNKVRSLGAGLNHLTFLYDIRYEGRDLHPGLLEQSRAALAQDAGGQAGQMKFIEMGESEKKGPSFAENPFTWLFYGEYGAVPAVLDRHVTEFFPERFPQGAYYGKTLGIDAFTFEGVVKRGDALYEKMKEQAAGKAPINEELFNRSEGEHEQLMEILHSLYTDARGVFSVNLPNNGAVPCLPSHAVLELPAVAAGRGFLTALLPDFPAALAEVLSRRIAVVDKTVEAAISGSRDAFVEALLLDGAAGDKQTAESLADELLEAHRPYLSRFF